jgi:hypothetical protein
MSTTFKNPYREALARKSMNHDAKLDAKGFGDMYHAEATFKIGAMPEVKGAANIENFVAQFFKMGFTKIEHRFVEVWDLDDALIFSAEATFHFPNGTAVTIPYLNTHKYKDNLYFETKIYIDTKALG